MHGGESKVRRSYKPFEKVDEEAPDDLETELPVQFSYFLGYLEVYGDFL